MRSSRAYTIKPRKWTAVLLALAASSAGAEQTSVQKLSGEDLYAAGASVQVSQPVAGDAVLAGGSVLIAGTVAADVLAAGGTVTLAQAVEDDVRAAGGSITATDRIGGDAIMAGGSVTLGPGSDVGGNAWIAGGVVHLSGTVHGDVEAAGGEVVISGRMDGNARILADSLEIQSTAVVEGTVDYRGPQPARVEDGARIGRMEYTKHRFERPGVPLLGVLVASLVVFLSLAVCTLIFCWLLPNISRRAAENARGRMLSSLGVGLLALIVTPVVASALFVLVVTTPLAVVLLAAYVIFLVAGCFVAIACLAQWLRARFLAQRGESAGIHLLAVLGAALSGWIVALVPVAGALIVLLAFITGAGGLILLAARLYRQPNDLREQ